MCRLGVGRRVGSLPSSVFPDLGEARGVEPTRGGVNRSEQELPDPVGRKRQLTGTALRSPALEAAPAPDARYDTRTRSIRRGSSALDGVAGYRPFGLGLGEDRTEQRRGMPPRRRRQRRRNPSRNGNLLILRPEIPACEDAPGR